MSSEANGTNQLSTNQAIKATRDRFPFKGYLDRELAPYETVGNVVSKYLKPGSRLFDFGSGPCDKTAIAQHVGMQCTAWDDLNDNWYLRDGNVDRIRSFAEDTGIDLLDRYQAFDEGSFDMVMMNDVLEHLHDSPREILVDLVTSLSEGGYLFVTVPNLANIRKRLSLLAGRTNLPNFDLYYWYEGPWRGPVREYVKSDLQKLAQHLGLQIELLTTTNHMLGNLPSVLRTPYKMATSVLSGWRDTWVLVARKPANWVAQRTLPDQEFAKIYGQKSREALHAA